MQMRQQQKYLSKLQKISQTSSPSKEQQSPIQTSSIKSRINPASLTTSYLKFKRFQYQKEKQLLQLQESINNHNQSPSNDNKKDIEKMLKNENIDDKNKKISSLQQMIIKKKMELNSLEESYQDRLSSNEQRNSQQEFKCLLKSTLKICQKTKSGREANLEMIFKYNKERKTNKQNALKFLVENVLKVTKQIFSSLTNYLTIPMGNNVE